MKKKKRNEQLEFEKKRFEELQLYHKSSFDLYVKKSNIPNSGYGVFTKSFIPKDSFIDFYYGNLSTAIKGGPYFIYINEKRNYKYSFYYSNMFCSISFI